jgi:hypothetical protein
MNSDPLIVLATSPVRFILLSVETLRAVVERTATSLAYYLVLPYHAAP